MAIRQCISCAQSHTVQGYLRSALFRRNFIMEVENADAFSVRGDGHLKTEDFVGQLEDSEVIVNLGTLAAKIAIYNFQWRFVTLIVYNTMIHVGIESFLRTYNRSVYLKFGKWLPKHRVHVPQFVIFGQDTAELADILQWIVLSKYDNTAKYIIVCAADLNKCDEHDMFKTLSRLYMVNVMFLKPSEYSYPEPSLFSYYPVLPGLCRNSEPVEITLSNCDQDACFHKMYTDKMINLYKCPFVISTLEQPPFIYLQNGTNGSLDVSGADGDILKELSEILNGTLSIRTPEDGEWGHFENNNWTGCLGDVFNKRAHASACGAPLTPQLHGNFQISYTYATLDMVWAARLPDLLSPFEKLMYPLKMQTRISLFAVFVIIILINLFMKTKVYKSIRIALNIGPTKVSLFFYSWLTFMGLPLLRFPSNNTLRFVVISWILFCYVMRTGYQAALVGSMKTQRYEEYLESFADVIKNKYPYGGIGSLREYYSEDTEVIADWVYVKLSKAYDVLDGLLNGTSDFVVALNKEYIIEHLMKFNGTKRVQILPEKIVNSPTVLYFKKFAPLKTPINRILSIMVEAGIIDMVYSRHLDRGEYLFRHELTHSAEPLTIDQFGISLAILFIGWVLSFVYFVIELIAKRFEVLRIRP